MRFSVDRSACDTSDDHFAVGHRGFGRPVDRSHSDTSTAAYPLVHRAQVCQLDSFGRASSTPSRTPHGSAEITLSSGGRQAGLHSFVRAPAAMEAKVTTCELGLPYVPGRRRDRGHRGPSGLPTPQREREGGVCRNASGSSRSRGMGPPGQYRNATWCILAAIAFTRYRPIGAGASARPDRHFLT